MSIDMSQFYQVFFEEAAEHLSSMESILLRLDVNSPDPEDLNAIFRAAHSIKGSSGTFGFTDLTEVTHVLENLLDKLRKDEIKLRPEMVDVFLEAGDLLKDLVNSHRGEGSVDAGRIEDICSRLRAFSEGASGVPAPATPAVSAAAPQEAAPQDAAPAYDIELVPAQALGKSGVANLLAELKRLGKAEVLAEGGAAGEPWRLRLQSGAALADVAEMVEMVAEGDRWSVLESEAASAAPAAEEEAYGFFDDAPGVPAAPAHAGKEEAYGFFDDAPGVPAQTAPAKEEAYGFFDGSPGVPIAAMPPAAPPVQAEAYGFFEGSPGVPAAPAVSAAPAPAAPLEPAKEPPKEAVSAAPAAKPATETRRAGPAAGGESSIRVSVEKVDQLINLVGELVITQAMLTQGIVGGEQQVPEALQNSLAQLERNTRDLQEAVMSIRMMPISFVFSRFPRVVRDLSAKLGKQIELKTIGENTELDKGLIEGIADPLTHLVRNSLDHGIESPEVRAERGKPAAGTITLRAFHQGGNIVIEVGDDGGGLNRDKILAKARERGLTAHDGMSDQEVWMLIFEPGFSTADKVTDVSGRGVGMDVVRRNIQGMGGRVEIDSIYGVGTRITVRLPLTLAILDGMSIGVGEETFILPLTNVLESLQPRSEDIETVANQGRVIKVRGEYLPVVVLHELFNIREHVAKLEQGIMIIIEADGAKIALFVDQLIGQSQVVIKSLEQNYRRVRGVSGATIMGDGKVALILDVVALVGLARHSQYGQHSGQQALA